jgi:hypothetical protein
MTTKEEIIAAIKAENPTLRAGSDEDGYVDLTVEEYEAEVNRWADARLTKLANKEALKKAEADKKALLAKLGITADEAKLLLS